MSSFKIITDSACDLPMDLLVRHHIDFVPFYVSFDGTQYYKEYLEMTVPAFYKKLIEEKLFAKTSLPSVQDYMDTFKSYLDDGLDVLCCCLSAKLSGSYQSAVNAANLLKEEYPARQVIICDSIQATAGQALIVLEAAKMRNAGYSIGECFQMLENLKHTASVTFTVDSLEYLKRGGRIGMVSALAGSILNIKPIIQLNTGELRPYSKSRGRKKALKEVVDIVMKEIGKEKHNYEFCLLNSECEDDARELAKRLKDKYDVEVSLPLLSVGVTIGSHVGPTAVGIASVKRFDKL
jgi:DegV family protein with EDD domain